MKDKFTAKRKPRKCPRCGSAKIAPIFYGMLALSPALKEKLDEGKVVLGGCSVTDCDPAWQCVECRAEVYREVDVFPEKVGLMPKAKPITAKQIDAILPFLENFETPGFSCGEWPRLESDRPNHFVMPMFDYTPAVCSFVEYLNDNGWIEPFDWGEWKSTAAQYVDSPHLLIAADTDTIRKLLTTHVRQDRFCEGHLAAMFENGHIVAILRRLKSIRKQMKPYLHEEPQ